MDQAELVAVDILRRRADAWLEVLVPSRLPEPSWLEDREFRVVSRSAWIDAGQSM